MAIELEQRQRPAQTVKIIDRTWRIQGDHEYGQDGHIEFLREMLTVDADDKVLERTREPMWTRRFMSQIMDREVTTASGNTITIAEAYEVLTTLGDQLRQEDIDRKAAADAELQSRKEETEYLQRLEEDRMAAARQNFENGNSAPRNGK